MYRYAQSVLNLQLSHRGNEATTMGILMPPRLRSLRLGPLEDTEAGSSQMDTLGVSFPCAPKL